MKTKRKKKVVPSITQAQFGRRFGISRQAVGYLIKTKRIETVAVENTTLQIPVSEITTYKNKILHAIEMSKSRESIAAK